MPEVRFDYIVSWWFEIGLCLSGATPLTWQEVKSWKELTLTDATPDELTTIIDMSSSYCAEYHAACNEKHRPPPPMVLKLSKLKQGD